MLGGGYGGGGFCHNPAIGILNEMSFMTAPTILILIPSLTLGGAEKQALLLAQCLVRHNVGRPIVVGIGKPGKLEGILKEKGIEGISLNMGFGFQLSRRKMWMRAWQFRRKIRALNPDLVFPLTFWPNVLGAFSCLGPGSAVCMWNQRSVDANLPYSLLERLSKHSVALYSGNSQISADFIQQRHHLPSRNKVTVLPNLISTESFGHEMGILKSHNAPRVLMMANFFPGKRQDLVLKGLKIWEDTQPDKGIELVFSGKAPGGYFVEQIKALAFDLNLKSKVAFCQFSSLEEALEMGIDIGLLATDSEGYSNSIMEYMQAGLPVLVSDIPANREVLGAQLDNQLFGPSPEEFASALQNLIEKKENWSSMGQANRADLLARHWEKAEQIWIQTLQNVLK